MDYNVISSIPVRQVAEAIGATILYDYCNSFERVNLNIIKKLQLIPK
jgi:hypothetical protein